MGMSTHKVAILTASVRGIGGTPAELLAHGGAKVIVTGELLNVSGGAPMGTTT